MNNIALDLWMRSAFFGFDKEDENEGGDDVDNDDDLIMRMAVKMVMKVVMMLICARV